MKKIILLLTIIAMASCQPSNTTEQKKPTNKKILGLHGPVKQTTNETYYFDKDSSATENEMSMKQTTYTYFDRNGNALKDIEIIKDIATNTIDTYIAYYTVKNDKMHLVNTITTKKDTVTTTYSWENDYKYTAITKKNNQHTKTVITTLNDSLLITERHITLLFTDELRKITHRYHYNKNNEPTKVSTETDDGKKNASNIIILSKDNYGNPTHTKQADSATGRINIEEHIVYEYY